MEFPTFYISPGMLFHASRFSDVFENSSAILNILLIVDNRHLGDTRNNSHWFQVKVIIFHLRKRIN